MNEILTTTTSSTIYAHFIDAYTTEEATKINKQDSRKSLYALLVFGPLLSFLQVFNLLVILADTVDAPVKAFKSYRVRILKAKTRD